MGNDKEIKEKYYKFIDKEIRPTVNTTDGSMISLSSRKVTSDILQLKDAMFIELEQNNSDQYKKITYTSSSQYYDRMLVARQYGANVNIFKIDDQDIPYFIFIARCINKDKYTQGKFATENELFKYLAGLIDDERYINQYRAAFTPSTFPNMSAETQEMFYEFIDNKFKGKLYKGVNSIFSISSVELNQRSIDFTEQGGSGQRYVYTSNSKYYKRITSGRLLNEQLSIVFQVNNNDPYFRFVLRCLNKDYKDRKLGRYNKFTEEKLSEYLGELISNDRYKNEYDIVFVPTSVNPGVNQPVMEEYNNFIKNEIEPKIKDMGVVFAYENAIHFTKYFAYGDNPTPDVSFVFKDNLDNYKRGKSRSTTIYGIDRNNTWFHFMLECLNQNSTENVFTKFKENAGLIEHLQGLIFNQQCKENYVNDLGDYIEKIKESNEKNGITSTLPTTVYSNASGTYIPPEVGRPDLTRPELPAPTSGASMALAGGNLFVYVILLAFSAMMWYMSRHHGADNLEPRPSTSKGKEVLSQPRTECQSAELGSLSRHRQA